MPKESTTALSLEEAKNKLKNDIKKWSLETGSSYLVEFYELRAHIYSLTPQDGQFIIVDIHEYPTKLNSVYANLFADLPKEASRSSIEVSRVAVELQNPGQLASSNHSIKNRLFPLSKFTSLFPKKKSTEKTQIELKKKNHFNIPILDINTNWKQLLLEIRQELLPLIINPEQLKSLDQHSQLLLQLQKIIDYYIKRLASHKVAELTSIKEFLSRLTEIYPIIYHSSPQPSNAILISPHYIIPSSQKKAQLVLGYSGIKKYQNANHHVSELPGFHAKADGPRMPLGLGRHFFIESFAASLLPESVQNCLPATTYFRLENIFSSEKKSWIDSRFVQASYTIKGISLCEWLSINAIAQSILKNTNGLEQLTQDIQSWHNFNYLIDKKQTTLEDLWVKLIYLQSGLDASLRLESLQSIPKLETLATTKMYVRNKLPDRIEQEFKKITTNQSQEENIRFFSFILGWHTHLSGNNLFQIAQFYPHLARLSQYFFNSTTLNNDRAYQIAQQFTHFWELFDKKNFLELLLLTWLTTVTDGKGDNYQVYFDHSKKDMRCFIYYIDIEEQNLEEQIIYFEDDQYKAHWLGLKSILFLLPIKDLFIKKYFKLEDTPEKLILKCLVDITATERAQLAYLSSLTYSSSEARPTLGFPLFFHNRDLPSLYQGIVYLQQYLRLATEQNTIFDFFYYHNPIVATYYETYKKQGSIQINHVYQNLGRKPLKDIIDLFTPISRPYALAFTDKTDFFHSLTRQYSFSVSSTNLVAQLTNSDMTFHKNQRLSLKRPRKLRDLLNEEIHPSRQLQVRQISLLEATTQLLKIFPWRENQKKGQVIRAWLHYIVKILPRNEIDLKSIINDDLVYNNIHHLSKEDEASFLAPCLSSRSTASDHLTNEPNEGEISNFEHRP